MKDLPEVPPHTDPQYLSVLGQSHGVQAGTARWQERLVFVKRLISSDPDTAARFAHEGQVAAYLDHPLVAPLLHHTHTDLIYPFIPGGTLRDLARCGPMTPDEATSVVWGILQAVAHLHSRGVVHHDLKPENVMLCRGKPSADAVRLIDFGMSYARHLPLDIHSGTRMGTPHFMAPEQFHGERGDPRSDLYSVGVLLFDCLAGHPPYEDALGWLVGITENRAELPGPKALHPVMLSAIQRSREARPQTVQEMQALLRAARRALGLSDLPFQAAGPHLLQ